MPPPNVKVLCPGLALCAGLALSVTGCVQPELSLPGTVPSGVTAQSLSSSGVLGSASSTRETIDRYCLTCHDQRLETAGLRLGPGQCRRRHRGRRGVGKGRA